MKITKVMKIRQRWPNFFWVANGCTTFHQDTSSNVIAAIDNVNTVKFV